MKLLIFLLLLTSCAAPNYLDSEIEEREIYLAGGGWECNDSTWRKIEVK